MKKKIIIIASIVLLLSAFAVLADSIDFFGLLDIQGKVGPLAHKVMDTIDQSADADGRCVIAINELTDFDWDTMVAAGWLSPLKEIKELPKGVRERNGIWSYLIFLKDGKVVYREAYRASVETSYKFNLNIPGESHRIFTPDNALIAGRRFVSPKYSPNDPNAPYFYALVF